MNWTTERAARRQAEQERDEAVVTRQEAVAAAHGCPGGSDGRHGTTQGQAG